MKPSLRLARKQIKGLWYQIVNHSLTTYLLPALVALAALGAQLVGAPMRDVMEYERSLILDGQIWRLVSGHLVHLGWRHLGVNLSALLLIWLLFGTNIRGAFGLFLIFMTALCTSLFFLIFHPNITWYLGLSGIIHGLFAAGSILILRDQRWIASAAIALLIGKLGLEVLHGTPSYLEGWYGGKILIQSHQYGALVGLSVAIFALLLRPRLPKTS